MNVSELERLLADMEDDGFYTTLRVDIARSLARRVIAAERLAESARTVINSHWQESHVRGIYNLERHLTAYEATK